METTLYRYFDTDGRLLYVGISGNNLKRQSQHKKNSEWFSQAATAKFEHFSNRQAALAAEKQAIQTEKPIYNLQYAKTHYQKINISEALSKLHLLSVFHSTDVYGKAIVLDKGHSVLHGRLSNASLQNKYKWSLDESLAWEIYVVQIEAQRKKISLNCFESCQDCISLLESEWYKGALDSALDKLKAA